MNASPTIAKPALGPSERMIAGRRVMFAGGVVLEVRPYDQAAEGGKYRPVRDARPGCLVAAACGGDLIVVADLTPTSADADMANRVYGSGHRLAGLDVHPTDAVSAEIEMLEREGRAASAALLRRAYDPAPRDPALVALGRVAWGSRNWALNGWAVDVAKNLVGRHAAGDFGDHGLLSDVRLDDDRRAIPMAYPQAVRNAVALERRSGFVLSEYRWAYKPPVVPGCQPAGVAYLSVGENAPHGDCAAKAVVVTYFLPGRAETYALSID